MHQVIVEVMPKAGTHDPQGQTIAGVLPKVGFAGFGSVRVGKRYELITDAPVTDEVLDAARQLAQEILANPLYDDVVGVYAAGGAAPGTQGATT